MTGRFITLEGIDGAGKSTHLQALTDWLQARGHEVVRTREPGGTPLAERLRALVLNEPMDALTETLLVFAARRDHTQELIAPALAQGKTVLCDRFTDATFAYQGGGRGFDPQVLNQLEAWVHPALQPDLTLWLDLPAEVAAQRRAAARQADRFEQEDLAFFAAVHQGYRARAQAFPQRFLRVDAHQAPDQVWESMVRGLEERGW